MTSPRPFEPEADEQIALFGETYFFQGVQIGTMRMVDAIDIGTRGTIYRLRDPQGRDMALKVFRPGFQEADLEQVCQRLESLKTLEGFTAARRRMVLPDDAIVSDHPQLQYAMLMPWIAGRTWSSLLNLAGGGRYLKEWAAVHLCAHFLEVMAGLESLGAAHTDIAAGNVIVDLETLDVQLIDLEDLFLPGRPHGLFDNGGARGYQHPEDPNPACPEGDRYATAILAAEMLLLARPIVASRAHEGGLLGDDHGSSQARQNFDQAQEHLRQICPGFLEILRRAWLSRSLTACPPISDLSRPVTERARQIARETTPALVRNPIQKLDPIPQDVPTRPRPPGDPPSSRIRERVPIPGAQSPSPSPPPPSPPTTARSKPKEGTTPSASSVSPSPPTSRSRVWKSLAWLAAISLASLVAIWLASNI